MESIIRNNEYISRIISQFLNANDAINFSCTCKIIHKSLGFETFFDDDDDDDDDDNNDTTTTEHRRTMINRNKTYIEFRPIENEIDEILDDIQGQWFADNETVNTGDGDRPQFYKEILSNVSFVNMHSICIQLIWKDQGWGNRKGKIYIVRSIKITSSQQQSSSSLISSSGNDVIYESLIAEHKDTTLTAYVPLLNNHTSNYVDANNYVYSIWVSAGGGGGHKLYIRDLCVKYLAYANDEEQRCYRQRQKFLRRIKRGKKEKLQFCLQLFKQVHSFICDNNHNGNDESSIFINEVKSHLKKIMINNGGFKFSENDAHSIFFEQMISNLIHALSEEQSIDFKNTASSSELDFKVCASPLIKEMTFTNSSSDLQHVLNIPLIFPNNIKHSIEVTCQWKDQGWGYRKGRMCIVRNKNATSTGEIVYESPIAEHNFSTLSASFMPRNDNNDYDDTYSIWCHVGSGGGHKLFINNLGMRYSVCNNESMKIPCVMYQELLRNIVEHEGMFFRLLLKEVYTLFCKDSKYYLRLTESEQQQLVLEDHFFQCLSKLGLMGFSDADVKIFDKFVA